MIYKKDITWKINATDHIGYITEPCTSTITTTTWRRRVTTAYCWTAASVIQARIQAYLTTRIRQRATRTGRRRHPRSPSSTRPRRHPTPTARTRPYRATTGRERRAYFFFFFFSAASSSDGLSVYMDVLFYCYICCAVFSCGVTCVRAYLYTYIRFLRNGSKLLM